MKKKIKTVLSVMMCIAVVCTGCSGIGQRMTEEEREEYSAMVRASLEAKMEEAAKRRHPTRNSEEDWIEEAAVEPETEELIEKKIEPETEKETEQIPESSETEEDTEKSNTNNTTNAASENTFDYVALGNSITCNEVSSFWWGTWGMAASGEEKDYVHIVSNWLDSQSVKPVTTTVVDLKDWELSSNRDSLLGNYDSYFNEYTDLVTIQTGENITEFKETLGSDYPNLVARIKEKAPNAQILMLGEMLWPAEDIEAAKQQACNQNGATFVPMDTFLNGYEAQYKSAIGNTVSGSDGNSHAIGDEAVAAHPNDAGMECIAQQIIGRIVVNN